MFYYLLAGASEEERSAFHLKKPEEYHYLNQVRDPVGLQHCSQDRSVAPSHGLVIGRDVSDCVCLSVHDTWLSLGFVSVSVPKDLSIWSF